VRGYLSRQPVTEYHPTPHTVFGRSNAWMRTLAQAREPPTVFSCCKKMANAELSTKPFLEWQIPEANAWTDQSSQPFGQGALVGSRLGHSL
jgi:hypothetical protein